MTEGLPYSQQASSKKSNDHSKKDDWTVGWEKVNSDPYDFEAWEALVRVAESANGGISRASNDADITNFKLAYDRFLARFPLVYGYWKKYADWHLTLYDATHAEKIYERAILAISNSVDLWVSYINFKVDIQATQEQLRDLFERAIAAVGLDFYSHPIWDKYIEYEELQMKFDRAIVILERVIVIPLHQYARYFDK